MKKLLGIIVFSLFVNVCILSLHTAWSGILDIFKEPVEICMNVLVDEWYMPESSAAKRCRGINKGELACMKRLLKNDLTPISSLRKCKSK